MGPPNKLKQIPQRHDLRNFRLLICLERTFLRASAAASSTSKSSVISVISRLLEFEDKTSSDKSFLLYLLLLNQEIRRRRIQRPSRRRNKLNSNFLEHTPPPQSSKQPPTSTVSVSSSSKPRIYEFYKFVGRYYSTLCVLQYFCSDYLVYKKERKSKIICSDDQQQPITTNYPQKSI